MSRDSAGRRRSSGAIVRGDAAHSLSDEIAERIKDELVEGKFLPGARLSADGLAREFSVSHIPVREALNRLQVEGHLMVVPNRGFFVPALSIEDVEDIYSWRQVIEDAAYRRAVPRLNDADSSQLVELNRKLHRALAANRASEWHRINRKFHFAPWERADSPRLQRLLDPLWDAASHYQSVLIRGDRSLETLQAQHDALVESLLARDVDAAISISAAHRSITLEKMREVLAC